MTDRERMRAIMNHEPVDRVIWQPRLEHWYNTNKRLGRLPERYRDMTLIDLYDDLGASMRPYHHTNPCVRRIEHEDVRYETVETTARRDVSRWITPVGTLETVHAKTEESGLTQQFPIKSVDDLKVVEFILRNRRWEFDLGTYAEVDRQIGGRGEPVVYNLRIPVQRLFIEYIGFENTVIAMHEHPRETDAFIEVIEETDDAFYDMIAASPLQLVNFGDNVDSNMLPPTLLEKYALPYYRRRTAQLQAAGKRSYPHWDGALKGILKFVPLCGFDGYEALTPQPMGDVPIEEIAEVMGHDYVLIDGLPATHFLPPFTRRDVEEFTLQVLDMFAPSLILGISDELPPAGDIEAVRMASQIVRDYQLP